MRELVGWCRERPCRLVALLLVLLMRPLTIGTIGILAGVSLAAIFSANDVALMVCAVVVVGSAWTVYGAGAAGCWVARIVTREGRDDAE